ncbi:MAG: DNA cytosine methyltransferase [Shinella sp.]|nr:DNA cytosine methyltransferase [Shinella sp.]
MESGDGRIVGPISTGGGKPGQGYPAIAVAPLCSRRQNADDGDGFPVIAFSAKDHGADALLDIAPTLRAGEHSHSHPNAGVMPAVAFDTGHGVYCRDIAATILGQHGKHSYDVEIIGTNTATRSVALRGRDGGATAELGDEVASALRASGGGSDKAHVLTCATGDDFEGRLLPSNETGWSEWAGWRVRRLMPVECERLQGMPDNYTQVPYRGKPAADGPRYKAIGNSMAVPCVEWLGRRIAQVLRLSVTP